MKKKELLKLSKKEINEQFLLLKSNYSDYSISSGCFCCAYCLDCTNCSYCCNCCKLINKKYCFLNIQLTKAEYEKFLNKLRKE